MKAHQTESILQDLDELKDDLGELLRVLGHLVGLRREGGIALEHERDLGQKLLGMGEPLLAYDALSGALRHLHKASKDPRLRQLRGLALARMGETRRVSRA